LPRAEGDLLLQLIIGLYETDASDPDFPQRGPEEHEVIQTRFAQLDNHPWQHAVAGGRQCSHLDSRPNADSYKHSKANKGTQADRNPEADTRTEADTHTEVKRHAQQANDRGGRVVAPWECS